MNQINYGEYVCDCGHHNRLTMGVPPRAMPVRQPAVNDMSICYKCGALWRYTAVPAFIGSPGGIGGHRWQRLTEAEEQNLARTQPQGWHRIQVIRRAAEALRGERKSSP